MFQHATQTIEDGTILCAEAQSTGSYICEKSRVAERVMLENRQPHDLNRSSLDDKLFERHPTRQNNVGHHLRITNLADLIGQTLGQRKLQRNSFSGRGYNAINRANHAIPLDDLLNR